MGCQRIVLHFGMDKTGSTSIRASLSRHLRDPDFHFVAPGLQNAGRCLAAAFKDDPRDFHYFRRTALAPSDIPRLRAESLAALDAELEAAQGRTAVLSAEAVSTFDAKECARLLAYFRRFSDDVRAVAYVRPPKGYIESNFQQQVKAGTVRQLVPAALLPQYRERFEPIDQGFGRERVTLWPFEPASFPERNVVLHFCREIGAAFDPAQVVNENASLSRGAVALLFAHRRFVPQADGEAALHANELLIRKLRKLEGPRLRLHSSLVQPAIDAKRDGIAWMEHRLGASLAEDLSAHDDEAIRSEDELLAVPYAARRWLHQQLGVEPAVPRKYPRDPRPLAWMVQRLQGRLARADARKGAAAVA